MKIFLHTTTVTLMVFITLLSLSISQPSYSADEQSTTPAKLTYLYGNHACPVSGEAVVADASVLYANKEKKVYGRIYLCCIACEKKAKKNLADLYNKLYRTDKKTGKPIAPRDLKNAQCPISGEPVVANAQIEYNGMIIHFCCPGCAMEFLENPEPKMAKLLPKAEEFKFVPTEGGSHKFVPTEGGSHSSH